MRNKLIIDGNYKFSFLKAAIKDMNIKVAKHNFEQLDVWRYFELLVAPTQHAFEYYVTNSSYKAIHKRNVLQMFLLYDKIILFDIPPMEDYTLLKATGFVEVEENIAKDALLNKYDYLIQNKEYMIANRDLIVDNIFNNLHYSSDNIFYKRLKKEKLPLRRFLTALYDMNFGELHNDPSSTNDYYIILNKIFENKTKDGNMFRNTWPHALKSEVCSYLRILEMSSNNNSTILQDLFTFPMSFDTKLASRELKSYRILKAEYTKSIGSLPHLNNIFDVLRLKESKYKEIQRLNEIIDNIEICLRNGETLALKKSCEEIAKATKELNQGTTYSKISKWISYLSVPVGVLETYLGIPPITGISLGAIGAPTTYTSSKKHENSSWLQIIR